MKIVQRGCGWPQGGKIYMQVDPGFHNTPIWNYVLCATTFPPDISQQGMEIIWNGTYDPEGNKVYDIYDWIGAGNYPNVMDWILEVDKFGFHQLIERTAKFDLISRYSYYYGVHSKAIINEPAVYFENKIEVEGIPLCPQRHGQHETITKDFIRDNPYTCSGLFINDIVDGMNTGERMTLRKMPSFNYDGVTRPAARDRSMLERKEWYQPGTFFRIPIGQLVTFMVYEDEANHTEELALKELQKLNDELRRIKVITL